ncbi:hypothetical protein H312_02129 [Anncaliia algerae PRA339]|uniref:Uncharacterized protein n=1 Tax=Anncaliia algerae PRA339 TaxID=1288291 RepID=A0A059EZI5_9MICR|nr:hypothetical protein H312_02129 [Anncaliia algerae PRA339]
MSSYEKRLKSFECSNNEIFKGRESFFAITGFVLDNLNDSDNVSCVFCQKSLEGWEKQDNPMSEHYIHSKKCFIFNLNTLLPRKKSFEFYKKDAVNAESLAKLGYFAYAIKENIPEIFCFKCGEMCNTVQKNYLFNCKLHFNKCNKRKPILGDKNKEDFFFLNMLKGKYNNLFDDYLNFEACKFDNSEKYIEMISGPPNLTVKEIILRNMKDFLDEITVRMENDENKAVNEIKRNNKI